MRRRGPPPGTRPSHPPRSLGACHHRGDVRALRLAFAAGIVAGSLFIPLRAMAAPPANRVVSLSVTGVVDPFLASYVKREIARANQGPAAAVLVTIDTPGGLGSSMREIVQAILSSRVPVICFV